MKIKLNAERASLLYFREVKKKYQKLYQDIDQESPLIVDYLLKTIRLHY